MPSKSHKNNGPKRKRLQGSVGHPSPSPGPPSPPPPPSSPSQNNQEFTDQFRRVLFQHVMDSSPDARKDSGNLACPFLKHDPERYAFVKNSCTVTGFKDVGSLRDHIKRVHSRKFGCTECFDHRFNCAKGKLKAAKFKHQALEECKESKMKREQSTGADVEAAEPVEWMSEEQEKDYDILDLRKTRQNNPKESFREIYTHLWPESKEIPDYRHLTGFIISLPVIEQVLAKMTLGPIGISSSTGLLSQQRSSYEQGTMAEPEPEKDRTPQGQQEEPPDMLKGNGPFYSPFIDDPSTAGIINRSFPPRETVADSRVPPFTYSMAAPTGRSNTDSGYETITTTENDSGQKPQTQLPQQRSHHDLVPSGNNWMALQHIGGPYGPEDPPEGEDIQLDEEEPSYDFNNISNAGDHLGWDLNTPLFG
ncbi:hypothetical protein PG990_012628 [Apiospora arundinis]